MPELPDIQIYIERLEAHVGGKTLTGVRIPGPFLLRTVQPAVREAIGRKIVGFRRIGKRIVFEMEEDLFLVLGLAAFDFSNGSLLLTEASTRKRASLHLIRYAKIGRGGWRISKNALSRMIDSREFGSEAGKKVHKAL
jgi:formamidopyrimidine-DNA glycosylase